MALPQVVIPGFAAFHLGLEAEVPVFEGAPDGQLAPEADAGQLEAEENPE